DQLLQAFGMMDDTASRLNLVDPRVVLNNHHPVLHTLFIGAFFKLGRMLGSDNVALFVCVLLQYIMVTLIFAAVFHFLAVWGVAAKIRVCLLAILLLTPIYLNYTITLSKDLPYAMFSVLYILFLSQLVMDSQPFYHSWLGAIGFALTAFGMMFTRHNGFYVLILTLPFVLLLGLAHKKLVVASLVYVLLVFAVVTKIAYPLASITPGSRRETLSIMVQQTARYVRTYQEEVTEQEIDAIANVLAYGQLADRYNPHLSDFVKETWNEDATPDQVREYFRVWFRMGLKHPLCYLEATLENTYGYFFLGDKAVWRYTVEESENVMGLMNMQGFELGYPSGLTSFRTLLLQMENFFNRFPFFSVLHSGAFYTWLMVILFFWCLRRGKTHLVLLLLPCAANLLIAVAGPVNAVDDVRYVFPIMCALPVAAAVIVDQT
ncbi:MAG: hypothetical protein IJU50_09430, partial [Lachnospiraceae bacterium]|nr:hypothetical protein [Lachnospiraceae bacterium]